MKRTAPPDAETLGLNALAHVVGDLALLPRFLELTGLTPQTLRDGASDPQTLAAALAFLMGHEDDARDFCEAHSLPAGALGAAHAALSGGSEGP